LIENGKILLMDINFFREKILGVTGDFPEISLIYLFGSQMTGNVGPLSDFDVGILVEHETACMELQVG
jgi:predicted nucleotidyltransferase